MDKRFKDTQRKNIKDIIHQERLRMRDLKIQKIK